MEETLSMNALIHSLFAVQFTLKHYNELAAGPGAADFDDETIEAIGETQMLLTIARGELSRAYEDARATITTQELPDYEKLCAGFVFR